MVLDKVDAIAHAAAITVLELVPTANPDATIVISNCTYSDFPQIKLTQLRCQEV